MIAAPERRSPLLNDFAGSYRFGEAQIDSLIEHGLIAASDVVDGYVLSNDDPKPSRFYPQWESLRRWSIDEFDTLFEMGFLSPTPKVELIDGFLIEKDPMNIPHRSSVVRITNRLPKFLPAGWWVMAQCPVVVDENKPLPDGAIVRGELNDFDHRDVAAADCGLIIEVADTSLRDDRRVKGTVYAKAGIPHYWIVNVAERRIETYSDPAESTYRSRVDFIPGQLVPLVLDGVVVATVPVDELMA